MQPGQGTADIDVSRGPVLAYNHFLGHTQHQGGRSGPPLCMLDTHVYKLGDMLFIRQVVATFAVCWLSPPYTWAEVPPKRWGQQHDTTCVVRQTCGVFACSPHNTVPARQAVSQMASPSPAHTDTHRESGTCMQGERTTAATWSVVCTPHGATNPVCNRPTQSTTSFLFCKSEQQAGQLAPTPCSQWPDLLLVEDICSPGQTRFGSDIHIHLHATPHRNNIG